MVGQVRPGPQGTMSVDVGGSSSRRVQGVVNYRWKEEERVCTKTRMERNLADGSLEEPIQGEREFILHDGTGGILVDPNSWDKGQHGRTTIQMGE